MTHIEIRYKATEDLVAGYAKLHLDLDQDGAIKYILPIFNDSVDFIYVQTDGLDDILELRKVKSKVVKSFVLNILDLNKIIV